MNIGHIVGLTSGVNACAHETAIKLITSGRVTMNIYLAMKHLLGTTRVPRRRVKGPTVHTMQSRARSPLGSSSEGQQFGLELLGWPRGK